MMESMNIQGSRGFAKLNKKENLEALMAAYYGGQEELEEFAATLPSAAMLSADAGNDFESLRFEPSIISSKNISSKTSSIPSGSPRSPRRSSLTNIDISVPEAVAEAVADDNAFVMVFKRMGNMASSIGRRFSVARGRNGKKGRKTRKGKSGKKTRRRAKK
jgi:hypothetical protein